jgi:hypothetical protein
MCLLATSFFKGLDGFLLDRAKAMELFTMAPELVFSKAHFHWVWIEANPL